MILFFDGDYIHNPIIHRVPHGHLLVNQLQQILVAGDNDYPKTLAAEFFSSSGDNVVGFNAGLFHTDQAKSGDNIFDERDLSCQFIWHRRPVRLILRIHLMPEHLAPAVKSHRNIFRLMVFEHFF